MAAAWVGANEAQTGLVPGLVSCPMGRGSPRKIWSHAGLSDRAGRDMAAAGPEKSLAESVHTLVPLPRLQCLI